VPNHFRYWRKRHEPSQIDCVHFGEREVDRVFVYWHPKGLFKEYTYILIEIVLQFQLCDAVVGTLHIFNKR
jgi:hypothetical protein